MDPAPQYKEAAPAAEEFTQSLSRLRHDLRNRLHVLLGYTELLQATSSDLSEKQLRWIQRIQIAAEDIEQIVNNFQAPSEGGSRQSAGPEDACR